MSHSDHHTPGALRPPSWASLRNFGYAVLWLGVGLLLSALLSVPVLLSQVRQTQLEGTPTGRKLVASADRILDCTDPKGGKASCYQQNQRRTAELVGQIGAGNILAVVCALQVENGTPLQKALDQVTACVARQLANARPGSTP